jgi:FG-GAP repeat
LCVLLFLTYQVEALFLWCLLPQRTTKKTMSITILMKLAAVVTLVAPLVCATLIKEEEAQNGGGGNGQRLLRRPHHPHAHARRTFHIQAEQQAEQIVQQLQQQSQQQQQQQLRQLKEHDNNNNKLYEDDADFWDRLLAHHAGSGDMSMSMSLPPDSGDTSAPTIADPVVTTPTTAPSPIVMELPTMAPVPTVPTAPTPTMVMPTVAPVVVPTATVAPVVVPTVATMPPVAIPTPTIATTPPVGPVPTPTIETMPPIPPSAPSGGVFSPTLAPSISEPLEDTAAPTPEAPTLEPFLTGPPVVVEPPTAQESDAPSIMTSAPPVVVEPPVVAPTTETESPVAAAPTVETEAPVAAPTTETESPVAAPTAETESPVAAPTAETESPVAAPTVETESPVVAPTTETEPPVAAEPTAETESPVVAPTTETESPVAAEPTAETESPVVAPTAETESPVAAPTTETMAPADAPVAPPTVDETMMPAGTTPTVIATMAPVGTTPTIATMPPIPPTGVIPTTFPPSPPTAVVPTTASPIGVPPSPPTEGGEPGTWNEIVTLAGQAADDRFGWDVALNNDATILAVGAYFSDVNGQDSGLVDIYRIDYDDVAGGPPTSTQIAYIPGDQAGGFLGISVALSGDGSLMLASGTLGVQLFQRSGFDDTYPMILDFQLANATRGFPGTYNGVISKDGTTIAISSRNGLEQAGVIKVWRNMSGTWTQVGEDIVGNAPGDLLGFDLAIDETGETLATAALRGSEARGYARIFTLPIGATGNWTQMGSDLVGAAVGDYFGRSIDIATMPGGDGDKVVAIGAYQCPSCNPAGTGPGRVQVYTMGPSDADWVQLGNSIEGPQDGAQFGVSVALAPAGDSVMVVAGANGYDGDFTANGLVQAYAPDATSGTWVQVGQDLTGGADGKNLGVSVAASTKGDVIAAGGPLDSSVARPGIGDALVYRYL